MPYYVVLPNVVEGGEVVHKEFPTRRLVDLGIKEYFPLLSGTLIE
jgi:hypothetical protein